MSHNQPNHSAILAEVSDLVNEKCRRSDIINILKKYDISIDYNNEMILSSFVSCNDFIGAKNCLELAADPTKITVNDTMLKMDPVNIIRFDGLFRAYGYECAWKTFLNRSVDIDDFNQIIIGSADFDQIIIDSPESDDE